MWFGHLERMGNERIIKKVCNSRAEGVRRACRSRRRCLDGMKAVLLGQNQNGQQILHVTEINGEWFVSK